MTNARWRTNPFTGVVNSLLITEEEHTIEFHPEVNAYGFYADEGIELDPGVPVILVEDNTAQTAFTEIPKTIAPNAGQYRVDYDAEGYFNTGFVNCNSGDVGKNILFTYYGTGTIVHPTFRLQTQFNLPGNLNVEGTSNFEGDVTLASLTGSTISASNKRIEDVSSPTASADAVPLGYLNGRLPFRNYEELTASGTWARPAGVDFVFVECIGGGGGGGGSNNTGNSISGGGASGEILRDLVSVAGDVIYTVGSGGAGGAASTDGDDGVSSVFSSVSAAGGKGGKTTTNYAFGGSADGKFSIPGGNGIRESGILNRGGNGGGHGGGLGGDGRNAISPTAGVANTGGGGGGGGDNQSGQAGGSGVIRIWY